MSFVTQLKTEETLQQARKVACRIIKGRRMISQARRSLAMHSIHISSMLSFAKHICIEYIYLLYTIYIYTVGLHFHHLHTYLRYSERTAFIEHRNNSKNVACPSLIDNLIYIYTVGLYIQETDRGSKRNWWQDRLVIDSTAAHLLYSIRRRKEKKNIGTRRIALMLRLAHQQAPNGLAVTSGKREIILNLLSFYKRHDSRIQLWRGTRCVFVCFHASPSLYWASDWILERAGGHPALPGVVLRAVRRRCREVFRTFGLAPWSTTRLGKKMK